MTMNKEKKLIIEVETAARLAAIEAYRLFVERTKPFIEHVKVAVKRGRFKGVNYER